MPLFIGALIGALIQAAGTLVGKVLLSLGIGYVTFTGVDTSITWARDQFFAGLSGMPSTALQLAGVLQVGTCVSIMTSALVVKLTLAGLTSGTLKKMVVK